MVNPISSSNADPTDPAPVAKRNRRPIVFAVLAILVALIAFFYRDALSLQTLAAREAELRAMQSEHPIGVYAVALMVYLVVPGLSLPGAAALTLAYGWFFGWLPAVLLVSFASTGGATLAFLSSRYFLRPTVESLYAESLQTFRRRLQDEGPFYLFTLRLIPAVPFFVINLVMGLTPISVRTYWWVSQLGMLPGTAVYVFAGSQVPDLSQLAEKGAEAVFEPRQLVQFAVAFTLLGFFPLIVRRAMSRWLPARTPD